MKMNQDICRPVREEPAPGEAKTFLAHRWIGTMWISTSTDHEKVASKTATDHRVDADLWDKWLEQHPGSVIAIELPWAGQMWLVSYQNGEITNAIVFLERYNEGQWKIHELESKGMPHWVIKALADTGDLPERYRRNKEKI